MGVKREKKISFGVEKGGGWPKLWGMEEIQRCFERYGRVWRPPQACGAGRHGDKARWRQIRDGLRECLEAIPLGHRGVESELQRAWMYVANQFEMLEEDGRDECQMLF